MTLYRWPHPSNPHGSSILRRAAFNNKIANAEPCCCSDPGCTPCVDGLSPESFLVEISGVANSNCTDCDAVNGSFVLDRVAIGAECFWDFNTVDICEGPVTPPREHTLRLAMDLPGGGVRRIRVFLVINAVINLIIGEKEYMTSIDCLNLSDESIPSILGNQGSCNTSGTTCLVTSL